MQIYNIQMDKIFEKYKYIKYYIKLANFIELYKNYIKKILS